MLAESESPKTLSERFQRYIPLAVWAIAVLTLLIIPLKIISYGYIPDDDALRHAAKAVSGKPWSEILVMRDDFPLDFHLGWHAILAWIHQTFNADAESLVVLSSAGLALLVTLSVLPRFRRPEAWLAALFAGVLAMPVIIARLTMGRPFLVSMAVYLALLFMWSVRENRRPRASVLVSSLLLIAAAAWIHGSSWYLLALPAAALLLAGLPRRAIWYLVTWLCGSLVGASLTGHPIEFLDQSVRLAIQAFGSTDLTRQLVTEFYPTSGDYPAVLLVFGVLLWRSRSPNWNPQELLNPIFLMFVIGWLLGLKVRRFSVDWGLPALLVWVALQFQEHLDQHVPLESRRRLLLTLVSAAGLFFITTSDLDSRWTWNATNQYLTPDRPELAGWLPEKDGIVYATDMEVFYLTFFKNPTASWRYVLGFESALMPPDDLAVLRRVHWNFGDVRAYEPWVKKMRPQDRLILRASSSHLRGRPDIPQLEWLFAPDDYWIGRLPRQSAVVIKP